jgi:hypothetical protein
MSKKFFTIVAGRKEPARVKQGQLSKTTGQPTGTVQNVTMAVGAILIPNYSRVWARRLSDDPKIESKKKSVAMTDASYRGKMEFLEWGDDAGEPIEIRYLQNHNTLDMQYQNVVLKARPRDEDAFLRLDQGLNNFDGDVEKILVDMFSHHSLMLDNKSKDPTLTDFDIVAYDSSKRNKSKIEQITTINTAHGYILDADKNASKTTILAKIFNIESRQQPDVIIEKLLEKAEAFPQEFVDIINMFKQKAEVIMEDALGLDVIDLDSDNIVRIITENRNGKDVLLKDTEGKGKDKIKWMISEILSSLEVYNAYEKIEAALVKERRASS